MKRREDESDTYARNGLSPCLADLDSLVRDSEGAWYRIYALPSHISVFLQSSRMAARGTASRGQQLPSWKALATKSVSGRHASEHLRQGVGEAASLHHQSGEILQFANRRRNAAAKVLHCEQLQRTHASDAARKMTWKEHWAEHCSSSFSLFFLTPSSLLPLYQSISAHPFAHASCPSPVVAVHPRHSL